MCGPCSETYRADSWHLIAAGMRGGKGVPEDAATHQTLFLTLTAPSFGLVHSRREDNGSAQMCHPRRTLPCTHGRRSHNWQVLIERRPQGPYECVGLIRLVVASGSSRMMLLALGDAETTIKHVAGEVLPKL